MYDLFIAWLRSQGASRLTFRLNYLSHLSTDFHETCVIFFVMRYYKWPFGSRSQTHKGQGQRIKENQNFKIPAVLQVIFLERWMNDLTMLESREYINMTSLLASSRSHIAQGQTLSTEISQPFINYEAIFKKLAWTLFVKCTLDY